MKNSLWKKHISTVVEINGHIYEIQLVAIFCSHMSHHQLEDGRAEMNNHAFLRTQKCCAMELRRDQELRSSIAR